MALTKQDITEYKELINKPKKTSVNVYQRTRTDGIKELFILVYSKGKRYYFNNRWQLKEGNSQEARTHNEMIKNQAEAMKQQIIKMLEKDYDKTIAIIKRKYNYLKQK